jgi:hypothetical protein
VLDRRLVLEPVVWRHPEFHTLVGTLVPQARLASQLLLVVVTLNFL